MENLATETRKPRMLTLVSPDSNGFDLSIRFFHHQRTPCCRLGHPARRGEAEFMAAVFGSWDS